MLIQIKQTDTLMGNLRSAKAVSNSSAIEWTDASWNPSTGCTKISPGCKNCYAEKLSKRLQSMGVKKYRNNFKFTEQPDDLTLPLKWKKQKLIFVNSM
jgi:protein gp37